MAQPPRTNLPVRLCLYRCLSVYVSRSSGQVSPASTLSGPSRPSPVQFFDDVQVPDDVMHDLTTAIQSTYGRPHVTLPRDLPAVTSADLGQGRVDPGQGRNVLEELSERLQHGRRSRDDDVIKPRVSAGVDAGHHGNNVRSSAKYPLLVHVLCRILLAVCFWLYNYKSRSQGHTSVNQADGTILVQSVLLLTEVVKTLALGPLDKAS